jgi:energy-coupling factor transporter transmembrane protein EcfT
MKRGRTRTPRTQALVADSPLRRFDPRTKLALSLGASAAVMLPMDRLLVFLAVYTALFAWGRLLPYTARQVWRIKWVLILLFILDTWLVGLDLAAIICLRLILLAAAFTLFFMTTKSSELSLSLEKLHLPYRYAFSLSLAFQSLGLLDGEWRCILEAQQARGALPEISGVRSERLFRKVFEQVRNLVALSVPAILLTTRRAWSITEAAYARGFDSPVRRPYQQLRMAPRDWLFLIAIVVLIVGLYWS